MVGSIFVGADQIHDHLCQVFCTGRRTNEYGTYHVTCRGVCSRYEFAQEILKLAGKDIELRAVPTEQSDLSAVRPPYAVLDNFILRIIEVYDMPDWKESLKEYMDERTED